MIETWQDAYELVRYNIGCVLYTFGVEDWVLAGCCFVASLGLVAVLVSLRNGNCD